MASSVTLINEFTKYFHVLGGITCFGLITGHYWQCARALIRQELAPLQQALANSFLSDAIIAPLLLFQFVSATALVKLKHYDFATPWINVAFTALTVIGIMWLIWLRSRRQLYRQVQRIQILQEQNAGANQTVKKMAATAEGNAAAEINGKNPGAGDKAPNNPSNRLSRLLSKREQCLFHTLPWLMIVLFVIIIHDAVLKHTAL